MTIDPREHITDALESDADARDDYHKFLDSMEGQQFMATDGVIEWSDDDLDGDYDYGDDDYDYDDDMDGDHDPAMRDAGWGTDEDYGYYDNGSEW